MSVLSTKPGLSKADLKLLDMLIDRDTSLQACTLTSSSADKRTPIVEAILYGNIDFLKAVFKSKAAFDVPFEQLIPLESD